MRGNEETGPGGVESLRVPFDRRIRHEGHARDQPRLVQLDDHVGICQAAAKGVELIGGLERHGPCVDRTVIEADGQKVEGKPRDGCGGRPRDCS